MSDAFWTAVGVIASGVTTGGVAILVTRRQVNNTQDLAREQRTHELYLAAEAREQTRKESAYQTIASYLVASERDMRWLLEEQNPIVPRPGPADVSARELAFANLFVSRDVEQRVNKFDKLVGQVSGTLNSWGPGLSSHDLAERARNSPAIKAWVKEALLLAQEVLDGMRKELGNRD